MKQLLLCSKTVPCAHLAVEAAGFAAVWQPLHGVVPTAYVLRHILTA
ncbi:hypothetical protein [Acetobacter cibinongensis]|nr:hypothetical protein [Acetobacter cibinongensis]